jgi:hypothetical protein
VHSLRVVNVPPERSGRQRELLRQRCHHWSIPAGELEQLDAAIVAAPTAAAAMVRLVDLCIADTGFVLVIVDDEGVRIPPSFAEAVQRLFSRDVLFDASPDVALSTTLTRPSPQRLERSVDRDLLTAILDQGDAAVHAWHGWRARSSLDDAIGIVDVAPMLSDNLRGLGIDDVDVGRIEGMRRRAWYLSQLLTRLATTAVDRLREEGCEPVLLGDLPAGVPVRSIDLCVPPDQAKRAGSVLGALGWNKGSGRPIDERRLSDRTWQPFRMEPRRALFLHWRPLPQGCSRLVPELAIQSPTARLLRTWARTGDPHPGHQLRTICDTAVVIERWSSELDWPGLWSVCERLGLVGYGETYLRALPAHLQALTRSPNHSLSSAS